VVKESQSLRGGCRGEGKGKGFLGRREGEEGLGMDNFCSGVEAVYGRVIFWFWTE